MKFVIIPYSTIAESGNIGMSPVCQSVHPHTFIHDDWMDCLHIWYHDQVPWAADARKKIEFDSVSNLSNCGNFFNNFECGDI